MSPGWSKGGGGDSVRATESSCFTCLLVDSTRPGWFAIGEDGVIRVSAPLDREQLLEEDEEVQLQVTVSEGSPMLSPQTFDLILSEHWFSALLPCSVLQATEKNLNVYGQEAKVSTWVTIRVMDVNDHKPEFYNCILPDCSFTPQEAQDNFTAFVDEHASTRIPIDNLTMVAYDPDKAGTGEGRGRGWWWAVAGRKVERQEGEWYNR